MVSPDDPRIARCGFCRLEGDGGLDFFAQRYEIALGRKSKSTHLDVVLGDNMNISRNHAKIVYREGVGGLPGHWELEVLGKNGVTVNGTLHTPSETGGCVKLRSGDHLSMGDNSFHFLLPARTIRHLENGQPVVKRLKLSHRPSSQARSNPPAKRPSVSKPRATTPPAKPQEASQEPAALNETSRLEQTLKNLMQDDKQLQDKLHVQEVQEAKLQAKLNQQQSSQQWSDPMRMNQQRDTPPTPFQITQQAPGGQQVQIKVQPQMGHQQTQMSQQMSHPQAQMSQQPQVPQHLQPRVPQHLQMSQQQLSHQQAQLSQQMAQHAQAAQMLQTHRSSPVNQPLHMSQQPQMHQQMSQQARLSQQPQMSQPPQTSHQHQQAQQDHMVQRHSYPQQQTALNVNQPASLLTTPPIIRIPQQHQGSSQGLQSMLGHQILIPSAQASSSGMTFRSDGFRSHASMPTESSSLGGYHPQQVQQLLRQLPPAIQQQVAASQQLAGYQAMSQQRSGTVSGAGLTGHASMPVYESSFQGHGSSSQGVSSMGLYQAPAAPRPITFPMSLQQSMHPQYSNAPQRSNTPQQAAMMQPSQMLQHHSYGSSSLAASPHQSFGSGSAHQQVPGRGSFASLGSEIDPRQGVPGALLGQSPNTVSTGLRMTNSMHPEGPAPT